MPLKRSLTFDFDFCKTWPTFKAITPPKDSPATKNGTSGYSAEILNSKNVKRRSGFTCRQRLEQLVKRLESVP